MVRKYSDYEQVSDEELIDKLRNGEERIMDYICDKYKNLVRSKAKSMFILGGDSEDLIQEGMIGENILWENNWKGTLLISGCLGPFTI